MTLQKSESGLSVVGIVVSLIIIFGLVWFFLNQTSSSTKDTNNNSTPDVIDDAQGASDAVDNLNQKRQDIESNVIGD